MRSSTLLAGGVAAILLASASTLSLGQTSPSTPAAASPPPNETIFARKILMGTIDMNMDEVESMLAPDGKFEAPEAREHVDLISVLLMAFPHMFPAATNQWQQGADRDAALDTFAAPELWINFADFYARATAASKTAFEASRAATLPQFKARMAELRAGCNGCHAIYMKVDK